MAPVGELLKKLEKLVVDNSPTILTGVAVTGALMTAYLTGRSSIKAVRHVDGAEYVLTPVGRYKPDPLPNKERFMMVWKYYIPPAATAALTIAAIIGANRIGTRRAAALAAAYSVSERAFSEYRERVVDKLGTKKEQQVRDELAQERVDKNPSGVVILGSGKSLCYEEFTGRYFQASLEDLRKAQNDINAQVIKDSYASLSDLYFLIGLDRTAMSDEVGWRLGMSQLELTYSYVGAKNGDPCISVGFSVAPVRDYHKLH